MTNAPGAESYELPLTGVRIPVSPFKYKYVILGKLLYNFLGFANDSLL